MYYITNQTNQIIAIDDALLDLLKIDTIEELTKKIILDELLFSSSLEDKLDITYENKTHQFTSKERPLSSVLGNFRLIHLSTITTEENTFVSETEESMSIKDDLKISDVEIDTLILKDEPIAEIEKVNMSYDVKQNTLDAEEELSTLIIPNAPDTTIDEISINTEEEALILDELKEEEDTPPVIDALEEKEETPFVLDETEEKNLSDVSLESITLQDTIAIDNEETNVEEIAPIVIDIDTISQSIGISQDDYTLFLDEYMDTAIALEDDLKSDTTEVRTTAIETLIQLAEVLHIPKVNEIVSAINILPSDKRIEGVTSFYNTLSSITVETQNTNHPDTPVEKEKDKDKVELFDLNRDTHEEKSPTQGFGTIDLRDIKPIPFPFKISQAAEELSLPEELIEEFVHDFITQAQEETQKMLAAYEKGNLDTIQKIGHLLKGTSSNLRIHALADTLYAIQFCEDSTKLEDLIKQYWGHFLSFEQQVDALTNKGKN